MMTISIGKADAECPEKVTLTSGMVNAVQIVFSFSEHWDEFKKIAVFSNGATTLDVPLDEESKCFVPHEVLEVAGKEVSVGVYGSKGEGSDYVAIPTEKCSLGKVVEGVNPTGEEPSDPTPTVLDDLILRVENLEKNGGGGGTSGNVPTKLSELEADSISRSDQEPFDFSVYSADFNAHEMNFGVDNLTFRNMGYGSGVSFDGQPLHDVGAPTSDNDAANKKFVDNKETAHDTSSTAHNDIRLLISGLTSRLNAVANSDDNTLDQLSEIVAYIKANKSLIDSITTSKVNVSDIIDNLTTSVSNKPLSAKMGVELKKLIDAIKIPTTLPASDVYSWAKQPTKPTYTAAEVGAVAKNQGSANVGKILVVGSDGDLVLADMPATGDVIGYIDENNNIIVQGDLSDGTYSFKYEMEDGTKVDIGNLVIDSNVYYLVTNNLTNCTSNNSATQVVAGESYSAIITANSGYELKSVSVTMGGSAVSVSGGVINIASVTGDIVITAVAEEVAVTPTYTNVLPLAIDANDGDYTGDNGEDGYNTNKKISVSSGNESTASACVSGFIKLPEGEQSQIRIKNITLSASASINNFVFYNANKEKISGYYSGAGIAGSFHSDISVTDGVYLFPTEKWFPNDNIPVYFRFSCGEITDKTIVTINEEIV